MATVSLGEVFWESMTSVVMTELVMAWFTLFQALEFI